MEDLILEFIEVATHQILYHRDLYPKSIFGKRLVYGVPVMVCQHPAVRRFIIDHLESLKQVLQHHGSDFKRFDMVVVDESMSRDLETYAFQIVAPDKDDFVDEKDLAKAEAGLSRHLRSFLLKLIARLSERAFLSTPSKTWTYTFRMHLTSNGEDFLYQDLKWCLENKTDVSFLPKKLLPVFSIIDPFEINFFIEA